MILHNQEDDPDGHLGAFSGFSEKVSKGLGKALKKTQLEALQ